MKNIFNKIGFFTISLTLVVFVISGCKDFLEVQPKSQISIADAFSNVANATNSAIGVYDELMGDNGYGIRINMYYPYDSDEMIVSGNLDNGRRGIGRYQLLLTNAELRNPLLQLYRGIEKANLCIEQIPLMKQYTSGTEADKKELKRLHGEVLTLRAQFMFELIRNWGDIPAPFDPAYKQTDLFIPQSNRDETYVKLLEDLKIATDLVPWRTEVARNERITKGGVKALRAKLAMFRGGYALRSSGKMERNADYLTFIKIARDECADLMAKRGEHTLNPNYEDIWRKLTSFTYDPFGEIIFEVGAGGSNSSSDSRMGNYNGPSVNASSRYGTGGGGLLVLPNYFYAFDSTDIRRDVTITTYAIGATNIKTPRRLAELTDGKFRKDWRVPLLPGTALNPGYNWPMIRFSDVLLMFAEAENEINNNPTAAAIAAFEEVRKRAFKSNPTKVGTTPTTKQEFFKAIVDERYLEFGSEGIRKFDLLRWNLLSTKLEEARANIQLIRDAKGPFANVPKYLFWKNNGEEIQFLNSFYKTTALTTAPAGWTRLDWTQHLTTNVIDGVQLHQAMARLFVAGKSELFPFDQATIDAYQGKLKQNPGY